MSIDAVPKLENNIIAIDPSLNCTAVIINDKKFIYAKEDYGKSIRTGKMKKWFENCEPYITYRWINYEKVISHSDQEIMKLHQYDMVSDMIIDDIKNNISKNLPIIIGIEGFSYSSMAGPLIDLVCFSTLLRYKIINKITDNITIMQPAELKLAACKFTYPPIEKGKKVKKYEYRNNEGISGGKFKKHEMFKALIDNINLKNDPWVKLLIDHTDDICLGLSMIPKPVEDVNDAKLLYEILKKINTSIN